LLRLAAESDVTVLLTGESGTGKELAARAVHSLSHRRSHPFVGVNCSAIPESLLESELFGHVKGAFTGATRDKVGLFQAAEGGTLFLDEVGDMSPILQVKVLRALQEHEIRRVGEDQVIKINVRLVTATNRDMPEMIQRGLLREDFYYRIRVFEIRLPPLRERKEDISLMVNHFIGVLSKETGKRIRTVAPEALKHLLDYSWPGNVRELRNVIRRAALLASGVIERVHLSLLDGSRAPTRQSDPTAVGPSLKDIAEAAAADAERQAIRQALQASHGNKTEAARRLRTDYKTLHLKIKQHGIDTGRFRKFRTT